MRIGFVMQEGGPDVRQRPLTGPANHVYRVYKEFQELGHEMTFLVRYQGQILKSLDLEDFEPVRVRKYDDGFLRLLERVVRGLQSRLGIPYANLFESLRFAEACCIELASCDLLYERMGWMGYGAGLAARRMKIPLVLEVNNGDFVTELTRLGVAPKGIQYNIAVWLMRQAVHRVDYSVATGEGHRRRYIEWWGVNPDLVTTVENGSDLVRLLKREQLQAYRKSLDSEEPVKVVFVGAFEPWHGILILLPAFAKALEQNKALHLVIIGSGTLYDQILEMIRELEIEERVCLTGQLNIHQVADELAKAHIGVAPYCGWMEYSGLKLFDYKAAGLPSVVSGENGQPAVIQHGKTGWIVPPCDQEALTEAILRLSQDRETRQRMGRQAREEAEQYHTWKHTVTQLEKVFNHVKSASAEKPPG